MLKNYPDAGIRDKYVGLARFFRAYFYFEKVRWYGDVPWYSDVISTSDQENLFKARDPRTLVMDSVLADIDFAIEHLDATPDVERVTKWTGLALKSRICLYEGTWRKYHTEFGLPDADRFLNECVSEGTQGNILANKNIVKTFDESKDYLWPLPTEDLTLNPNRHEHVI